MIIKPISKIWDFLIIVPCEKISAQLKQTIASIKRQSYKNWRVVVVTSFGKKKTDGKISYIVDSETQGNPAKKRNHVLKSKKFDYVLFLDDDVLLDRKFLENAKKILQQKNVSAVVGPLLSPQSLAFYPSKLSFDLTLQEKVSGYIWESSLLNLKYSPQKDRTMHDIEVKDYSCAAMVVKYTDFKKIGGFSEKFFPGEDTKLCLDITKKLHKKIIRSDRVIAYHRRRSFPLRFLRQIARYGFQRGKFAVLFPETSRHSVYFVPTVCIVYTGVLGLFGLLGRLGRLGLGINLILSLPFAAYLFFLIYEVAIVYGKEKRVGLGLLVGVGIVMTHIVYGVQFGRGVINIILRRS